MENEEFKFKIANHLRKNDIQTVGYFKNRLSEDQRYYEIKISEMSVERLLNAIGGLDIISCTTTVQTQKGANNIVYYHILFKKKPCSKPVINQTVEEIFK